MTAVPRSLDTREHELVSALLGQLLVGRDRLAKQLQGITGEPIDENGSLRLSASGEQMPMKFHVPVEAWAPDVDGVAIHYLLHVVEGRLAELEVYKDDSTTVIRHPSVEELQWFVPE